MVSEKASKEDLPHVEANGDLVEEYPGHADPAHYGIDERRLMTKIDLRVVPVLCVLYLLAFLDRVNISNAAIFGLREELNLNIGTRYNTVLVIFFVPYILFEIPSNIILKKFKPHMWVC